MFIVRTWALLSCICCAVWAKFGANDTCCLPRRVFVNSAVLRNQDEDEKATLPDPKATFLDQKATF